MSRSSQQRRRAQPEPTGSHAAEPFASRQPVLAIVGPTASGKSAVALEIAERAGAEIVAVDSMTIYRGMDIGTAKPSAGDRRRVPHHLLDIAEPSDAYSVARFQRAARAAIGQIHGRGRIPLLTGGSGLYFRAVVDDLRFPPTDPSVRARIASEDSGAIRRRLRDADPGAFDRIEEANVRRAVRALEVLELTGVRFSEFRESWDAYESRYALRVAGLRIDATELSERISQRTAWMMSAGLVDEVRALMNAGLRSALTASRAIAYREIVWVLDGNMDLDEAVSRIESATRQYARRQMTWFRKDPRIVWFDALDPGASERILELFRLDA